MVAGRKEIFRKINGQN